MALNNLKKLQKLVANVEGGSVTNLTKDELDSSISDLLDFLADVNKKNRSEFESVVQKMSQMLTEERTRLQGDIAGHRGSVDSKMTESERRAEERLAEHMARMDAIEDAVEKRFGELFDGSSAATVAIVDALKPYIPKPLQGSPDSAEDIRNKLELLSGEDRLDKKAIAGLDDYEEVKKLAKAPRGGGGSSTLWQLADVDIVSTQPTNGQVLAYNGTLKQWKPSSAGAGTGDVNKVGTPVNNQVGVWTGDGTIEGDASLTFDGTNLNLATAKNLQIAGATVLADAAGTTTLSNIDALDATTEATIESAIDALSNVALTSATITTSLVPTANDGAALGSGTNQFSDLYLASGGVVNFDNGDMTITDGTNALAFAGGNVTFDSAITPAANNGAALGAATTGEWSDLFLAEGGVINWDNGDATITQTGNVVELAGADLTVPNLTVGAAGTITLSENASIALDPAGSADGKYSGITITGTAGADLAFGDLIYLDPTDSRWELADANAAAAADGDSRGILGICVNDPSGDGQPVTVLLQGVVRADAAFPALTIGAPVYVSETAGDIVVTQPTTTDVVIRIVGVAITADEIFFRPDFTWVTHT